MEPSLAGKSLLNQYGVELCWDVSAGKPQWSDSGSQSGLAVARVSGNMNFTARQWRETIETCLECFSQQDRQQGGTHGRTILLMIDSAEPKVKDLRTAMMIGDMLVMPMML